MSRLVLELFGQRHEHRRDYSEQYGGDEQHCCYRHPVIGPSVHHLAERLGAHAHSRGHGHHFAGHRFRSIELDGGHGDEVSETAGNHCATSEDDEYHELGPCADRQQEYYALWNHG